LECPPSGGISIPSSRRLKVDVRPLSLRRRDRSLRRVSRRACRCAPFVPRPRDRVSPQSRLPWRSRSRSRRQIGGQQILPALRTELHSNRPNGSGTNKIVESRSATPCRNQEEQVKCASKLNQRKPRVRNLKKFEERLTCSGPSSSVILKSGCLRASVSGRYRSLPARSKVT
jgi:hypothetical protein